MDSKPAENIGDELVRPDIVLTITMKADDTIGFTGPLADRNTCFKMLDLARHLIFEHHFKLAMNGNGKSRLFGLTRGH